MVEKPEILLHLPYKPGFSIQSFSPAEKWERTESNFAQNYISLDND